MKLFLIFFYLLLMCSCSTKHSKEELWSMMKSANVDSIVNATTEIQNANDTTMVDAVLYNSNDPRVLNRMKYKGMSVFQIKMNALHSLLKVNPPREITYNVDTSIITFYSKILDKK